MSETIAQRRHMLMRYGSMIAGPLLCALIYFSMPSTYSLADGSVAQFSFPRGPLALSWRPCLDGHLVVL